MPAFEVEPVTQLSFLDESLATPLEQVVDPVGEDVFVADSPFSEHELGPEEQAWIDAKGQQGLDLLERIGAEGMLADIRERNLGGRGVIEGRIEVVYPVRSDTDKAKYPFDVVTTMSLLYPGGFYDEVTEKFGRVAIGLVDNGNWGIAYATSPNERFDTEKDVLGVYKQLRIQPVAQLDAEIPVFDPQQRVAHLPVMVNGELTQDEGLIDRLRSLTQRALDTRFAPQPGQYAA